MIAYLVLNIHAAAPANLPYSPATKPPPHLMPNSNSSTLIEDIVKSDLSDKLYTPKELQDDRDDLNSSWLDVQWNNKPLRGYYKTSRDSDDRLSTKDGWPTETFAEFGEFQRLLVGFGDVDPQMEDYDFDADSDTIFAPNELLKIHNTSITRDGTTQSGCLFSPADQNKGPLTSNASWASSSIPQLTIPTNPNTTTPIPAISNLTACGLSPILNTTFPSNQTADQNPTPYLAIAHSSLWSWAPSEPKNATNPRKHSRSRNTCAVLSASDPYPGRWYTADCKTHRRAACQSQSNPWDWRISSTGNSYFHAGEPDNHICPDDYTFSVPHTALENTYLLHALRSPPPGGIEEEEPIYINLNSLHTPQCWTLGGPNATCPYTPRLQQDQWRVVVIPTIAAVIIFVLAAATAFVKGAANRREMRRGKRRVRGESWEYEGVPS
jgi:hypothetical protein